MAEQGPRTIILCNWNDGGDRIVRELHADEAAPNTDIRVVADMDIHEAELRKHIAYRKVHFIKSDPVLHHVLAGEKVDAATTVIILADTRAPDPDAKSAMIALAVSSLCHGDTRPRILAEAMNHRRMEHLKDAGCDEVICAADFGLGILAQCALHPKLSIVYNNLLTYSADTNEVYVVAGERFPRALLGMTFAEGGDFLNRRRDRINPAILIGVRRGEEVFLNPQTDRRNTPGAPFDTFREGDALIVISYGPPDLSQLGENAAAS